ncbi:coiled-coil domain-containing protein 115 [Dunckerocampus dactyliophorus]|uniref:coiled-coil domain-containing protein 115 n=1 Tax=Dunckerocampus dactyliophorus TaxID=161453 RepID=UPI002405298E|nr:coiled-coil domain-containing protein 115 [Dunckerocampus dactyliophorus]
MGVSGQDERALLLDEKLLTFMDQLELLEEKRARLNTLIEQGWFSISKARYSMGNKQVSALQYASEMEPLVCVHLRTLNNDNIEFCAERESQKSHTECKNETSVEDVGPQDEGIRRRIKTKKDSSEKEVVAELRGNLQQNPLKWFGILVPQALKQAQSSFNQVIELTAEIATLQVAIVNTRQELKDHIQEKVSAPPLEKAE